MASITRPLQCWARQAASLEHILRVNIEGVSEKQSQRNNTNEYFNLILKRIDRSIYKSYTLSHTKTLTVQSLAHTHTLTPNA